MAWRKAFGLSLALCSSFLVGGCQGEKASRESASPLSSASEYFVCEATYPGEKRSEIKTGDSMEAACEAAVAECNRKVSPVGSACLIKRWYDSSTTPDGLESGQGWACEVTENNGELGGRTWVRPGDTQMAAYNNALKYCSERKAGNNCQIVRCFDASFE